MTHCLVYSAHGASLSGFCMYCTAGNHENKIALYRHQLFSLAFPQRTSKRVGNKRVRSKYAYSRLGGVVVSVFATGSRVAGLNPAEAMDF
jgi:hypothetical protein